MPASSAQRRTARLDARAARAEQWGSVGSGYYKVECPTTIEPHPLFSFQGREPCPICLDDLSLAPAVAPGAPLRRGLHGADEGHGERSCLQLLLKLAGIVTAVLHVWLFNLAVPLYLRAF